MNEASNNILKNHAWLLWLAGGISLILLGLVAIYLPQYLVLFGIGGLFVSGVLFLKPHWILFILLLIRSSADVLQDTIVFFPGSAYNFNTAGMLNIFVVGVGLLLLIRRFARGQTWLPSPPLVALGLYLFVASLSIPTSIDRIASLKAWARTASYLGIALLSIEALKSEKDKLNGLRVITLSAIPPLILGYYQAITGQGYFFGGYVGTQFAFRPNATFGRPASLSAFLITIICILIASYVCKYPLWPKWFLIGFTSACLGLLVLTYARTEWIGMLAALGVMGLVRFRRLLVIGLILVLCLILLVPSIQTRLTGEKASESFDWRLLIWEASIDILETPTLFGSGLDTSPELINEQLVNEIQPPHNDYLRYALESGIVGLLSYLVIWLTLLRESWRTYQLSRPLQRTLGLTMLAITTSIFIVSIADNYFSFVSVQWYNWTLIGIMAVLSKNHNNENAVS